ncbi:uberolysin/carnocyclin family circular bacteriocin [Sporolactobacillus shoreicorticis]|uniref:Uberolysin/carnocyclin family circular bacteriocin n=1 Tax=Sporolactobacillus shoreicorticis TaxID=1923877 RepID=A0ABW5S7K9_9BACL|nr:uberolysin/carnocyclin family circular bacteriocin [Sporolactobacillus shoreicorticis]MCO7128204.1 uberolysin/carnocyclin family circular bacteriocin [Sporolactobacillus shoreicorticis]
MIQAKNRLVLKISVAMAMILGVAFTLLFVFSAPNLAGTLGISAARAKTVINIIDGASSIYAVITIIAAIVGGGAASVGLLLTAKALIKKFGKKYAIAW